MTGKHDVSRCGNGKTCIAVEENTYFTNFIELLTDGEVVAVI